MKTLEETPLRSINGYWVQVCGSSLTLHSFVKRNSQNKDGSGYNVFTNLKPVVTLNDGFEHNQIGFSALRKMINYMNDNNIRIEKDCCILDLPEELYK